MPSSHGNLYQHATCLIYGYCARQLCSLLWSGGGDNGREETRRPDVTVLGNPAVEASGRHKNNLVFVGRMLVHVQLYGDQERGGGGEY